MNVMLSETARMTCDRYSINSCYACPLKEPCGKVYESKDDYRKAMNEAAEKLEQEAA